MVAACEGAHGVDDHADGVPDEARDAREAAAEDLEVDAAAVGWGDGVGDEGEGEDDAEEAAKGTEGFGQGGY